MSQFLQDPEEAKEYLPMYRSLYVAVAVATCLFALRLWYLQIIEGQELREFSEKNRIKQVTLAAPRGLILDREGRILVDNLPGFVAIISPQYTENLEDTAAAVGDVLGIPRDEIKAQVQKSKRQNGPFFPVRVKENLSRDEVFRLKTLRLAHPGLDIRETILRHYNLGESGAQLFGFVGEISEKQLPLMNEKFPDLEFKQGDIIGKDGLEQAFEREIRGRDGVAFVQVDARGREANTQREEFFGQSIQDQEAVPGANVKLTIDMDIQKAAWKSMVENERIGGVVALNPKGEVLAWVSAPSYNPNDFATGISGKPWSKLINDPYKPLRNKVIQDHHSPGSTFKPFVALTALQENEITEYTVMDSPPYIRFGRRNYHDHSRSGHGRINIKQAIERSSNVFFYRMGIELGIDRMSKYISLLGIGQRTNIELGQERTGLMPTSEWKERAYGEPWQPGENLSTAIGQGFVLVTPLQMAVAYNTIAAEGLVYKPFIVKEVLDPEMKTVKKFEPELVRNITEDGLTEEQKNLPKEEQPPHIKKAHFKVVKDGLWRVANGDHGSGRWHKVPGIEMAGKTGTSQVISLSAEQLFAKCEDRPMKYRHNGWYVAFAPFENPEITVAVLTEHSCSSGKAVPIVRDVMQAYMEKYHPERVEEGIEQQKLAWKRKREIARREAQAAEAQATQAQPESQGEAVTNVESEGE